MNAELEPGRITELATVGKRDAQIEADRQEAEALGSIESVQDPDAAEQLLKTVTKAADAVRIEALGRERTSRWVSVTLKAQRRYGELLGPARRGPPSGNRNADKNNVERNDVVSKADRDARAQARKVARVPLEVFNGYLASAESPSCAGLLREANPPKPRDKPAAAPPPSRMRPKNWDGKSNDAQRRKLHSVNRDADYFGLREVARLINRLCMALEDIHFEDYHLEGAAVNEAAQAEISEIHDHLISLGEWHDHALSSIQHWLEYDNVLRKIDKLRQTDGRSPEEAQTALMLADRLERKLSNRVSA